MSFINLDLDERLTEEEYKHCTLCGKRVFDLTVVTREGETTNWILCDCAQERMKKIEERLEKLEKKMNYRRKSTIWKEHVAKARLENPELFEEEEYDTSMRGRKIK